MPISNDFTYRLFDLFLIQNECLKCITMTAQLWGERDDGVILFVGMGTLVLGKKYRI